MTILRQRFPTVTVADLYDHPRLGSLAQMLDDINPGAVTEPRIVAPTPRRAGLAQVALSVPLTTLTGLQWVTWLAIANNVLSRFYDAAWITPINWWIVVAAFIVFITPLGRMVIAAAGIRMLLAGVEPGDYPRGGSVHLRLWIAERLTEASGAANLSGAPWMIYFARSLGAQIGRGVDMHTLPPVTGMITLGDGCSVEPEVDLAGWWIDGDVVHIGDIEIGSGASVGSRSTLMPGTRIGPNAEIAPGSAVMGKIKGGQLWAGSPAVKTGKAQRPWPDHRPEKRSYWVPIFGDLVRPARRGAVAVPRCRARGDRQLGRRCRPIAVRRTAIRRPAPRRHPGEPARLRGHHRGAVRLLSIGMQQGYHPVR